MLRLPIQQRLERGTRVPSSFHLLARAWSELARVERPLTSPIPILCIGGSTLGGSGRTPLAIACARALVGIARARVALVSHAYGARPPSAPRNVETDDDVRVVGDEALECAQALARDAVSVVVARDKQRAIDWAAACADVIVLDGPLQLTPRRATLSLLAVSAVAPWGSGACPPAGDLRAPREALERASDRRVTTGEGGDAAARSNGAWLGSKLVRWENLRSGRFRIGLATGIARPERVEAFVRAHGVVPSKVVRVANHARLELKGDPAIDLWLITGKDAHRTVGNAQTARIDYHLDLPSFLNDLLRSRFSVRF